MPHLNSSLPSPPAEAYLFHQSNSSRLLQNVSLSGCHSNSKTVTGAGLLAALSATSNNQAQHLARLLFPLWPQSRHAQELTLFRLNGVPAQDILTDPEASGTAPPRSRASRRFFRTARPRTLPSIHEKVSQPIGSASHAAYPKFVAVSNGQGDGITEVQAHQSHNNKKRKSSRSGIDTFLSDAKSLQRSSHWSSSASNESDGEYLDEDGGSSEYVERPDVSASTFRASRVVDKLFTDGSELCESDDDCQCCTVMDKETTGTQSRITRRQARLLSVPYCDIPWAARQRLALRARICARVVCQRVFEVAQRSGDGKCHQKQGFYLPAGSRTDQSHTVRANGTAGSAGTSSGPASAKARNSRAEQRALALKGGRAGNPKVSLAELRARTRESAAKEVEKRFSAMDTGRSASSHPAKCLAAAAGTSKMPTARRVFPLLSTMPFSFKCSSVLTSSLDAGRKYIGNLLAKPFDQVMQAFDFPNYADANAPTMYLSIPQEKCPMLYPEADRPRAKFCPRPTVSASWPLLGQWMQPAWSHLDHTQCPTAHTEQPQIAQLSSGGLMCFSTPDNVVSSLASSSPRISRRNKASVNNIHPLSSATRWTPSSYGVPFAQQPRQGTSGSFTMEPGLDHPTTTSWIFPDEHICLFCEYELFYGEYPRFLNACEHRRKTLKARRRKKVDGSLKEKTELKARTQSSHSQTLSMLQAGDNVLESSFLHSRVNDSSLIGSSCCCGKSHHENEVGCHIATDECRCSHDLISTNDSVQVAGTSNSSVAGGLVSDVGKTVQNDLENCSSIASPQTPRDALALQSRLNPWDVLTKYGLPPPLPPATRAKFYADTRAVCGVRGSGADEDNLSGESNKSTTLSPRSTPANDLNLDFPTSYDLTAEQRRDIAVSRSFGPQYLAKRLLRAMESFTRNRPCGPSDPVWIELDLAREAVPFEMMKEVVGETKRILSSMKQDQARTSDALPEYDSDSAHRQSSTTGSFKDGVRASSDNTIDQAD